MEPVHAAACLDWCTDDCDRCVQSTQAALPLKPVQSPHPAQQLLHLCRCLLSVRAAPLVAAGGRAGQAQQAAPRLRHRLANRLGVVPPLQEQNQATACMSHLA